MKKIISVLVSLSFLLAIGCAQRGPIIDTKGVDMLQYSIDLNECKAYANEISPATNAVIGAGVGAAVGAGLGAIVGAFFGCAGKTAGLGAALGGASGAGRGAGQGVAAQRTIVNNCMAQRGYRVLY